MHTKHNQQTKPDKKQKALVSKWENLEHLWHYDQFTFIIIRI